MRHATVRIALFFAQGRIGMIHGTEHTRASLVPPGGKTGSSTGIY